MGKRKTYCHVTVVTAKYLEQDQHRVRSKKSKDLDHGEIEHDLALL